MLPSTVSVFFQPEASLGLQPLITSSGQYVYAQGLPTTKPDTVEVIIFDEVLTAATGVYSENYSVGDAIAIVTVPVTEVVG